MHTPELDRINKHRPEMSEQETNMYINSLNIDKSELTSHKQKYARNERAINKQEYKSTKHSQTRIKAHRPK